MTRTCRYSTLVLFLIKCVLTLRRKQVSMIVATGLIFTVRPVYQSSEACLYPLFFLWTAGVIGAGVAFTFYLLMGTTVSPVDVDHEMGAFSATAFLVLSLGRLLLPIDEIRIHPSYRCRSIRGNVLPFIEIRCSSCLNEERGPRKNDVVINVMLKAL